MFGFADGPVGWTKIHTDGRLEYAPHDFANIECSYFGAATKELLDAGWQLMKIRDGGYQWVNIYWWEAVDDRARSEKGDDLGVVTMLAFEVHRAQMAVASNSK